MAWRRWLSVLAVVLGVACLVDWLVDLSRDTPVVLRVAFFAGQAVLCLLALMTLGVLFSRRPSDTQVALWVEEKLPRLGHRLISAVQLNRRGAATRGMSPDLIAAVTREAEAESATTNFTQVADARRVRWGLYLLLPLVLLGGLFFLLWPETVEALVARQLLADRRIPRSVTLADSGSTAVWPAGEPVLLQLHVRGEGVREDLRGEVRIDAGDGRPAEGYELAFDSWQGPGEALFVARVPASSTDFAFDARLKDGRTHRPGRVHFEPRPVVQKQEAWVQLPARISLRPADQPYEEPQKNGDIVHRFAGSSARLAITVQKPIDQAIVELVGPVHPFIAAAASPQVTAETVRRSMTLPVREDGRSAEGVFSLDVAVRPEFLATLACAPGAGVPWAALFLSGGPDLLPAENGYRVMVRDRFGLANADPPRRAILAGGVEPPEVVLLPEFFWKEGDQGPAEDREVEGIPALLGQRIRIEYAASGTYGLERARLRYRVLKSKQGVVADESGPLNVDEFLPLPLGAARGKPASQKASEEFTAYPAQEPGELNGTRGGGRYDFDTTGIPDGQGGLIPLQPGDRIQFYLEVFGRPDPEGRPGRSVVREKEVVALRDFLTWLERKEDQKEKLRQLEEKQRGRASISVVDKPLPTPQDNPTPPRVEPPPSGELVLGRSWQLLGVFPSPDDSGHATPYPPETDFIQPTKEYQGLEGNIRWQTFQSPTDLIDLKKFFQHGEAGVAYAVCWVQCGRRPALLSTGSDDGIKVWINRGLVLDKAVHRPAIPGEDQTPVEMADGWNEILVKVDNRLDTWGFYLDLRNRDNGRPLDNVKVRLTPPAEEGHKFVRNWQMIGPFRLLPNDGRDHLFPPEAEKVKLDKEYEGRYEKIRWREVRSSTDKIDVLKGLALPKEKGVGIAYAVCWVRCDQKRAALFVAGSDGGFKVWVNRRRCPEPRRE